MIKLSFVLYFLTFGHTEHHYFTVILNFKQYNVKLYKYEMYLFKSFIFKILNFSRNVFVKHYSFCNFIF